MRYAVYFTPPPGDPLTDVAARWLGRNPFPDHDVTSSSADLAWVQTPRRYGFHATLKAPFRLAVGKSEADLLKAFREFCGRQAAFVIPSIELSRLGPFFALVESAHSSELQAFANEIVRDFEPLRAPLTAAEIERRNPEKLSDIQRNHLMAWGYPYVFDTFRFHMTLTGAVDDHDAQVARNAIEAHFSEHLKRPLPIAGLAVFVERKAGAEFEVLAYSSLAGGTSP